MNLFLRTKVFQAREQFYNICKFYRCPRFAFFDLAMGFCSLFFNPYRISKTTYGETPLRTFQKLVRAAEMTSADRYLELGSGRGKTCVWVALFIGCKAKGVEWIPLFVRLSRLFSRKAQFVCGSMFEIDLSTASVIYYYHLDEKRPIFETMAPGARLITISEPIESEAFTVVASLDVEFPWGRTQAYVQKRNEMSNS